MDVYVYGADDRQESKDLMLRVADSVSKKHHVINASERGLEADLYKAEKADALVLRLDDYDDATWALIGMARAGNRPIVPLWNASYRLAGKYQTPEHEYQQICEELRGESKGTLLYGNRENRDKKMGQLTFEYLTPEQ